MNQTGISSTVTIRGISSGVNQAFEQSVGMYVDGVHYGRGQLSRLPMFDMARVEVLRGPQPILFGKNSIAGAISMITEKPSEEFEGSIAALYEPDHGEQDYRLVVNGGLTDNLFGRASIMYREMDGWIENVSINNEDEKQEEETVVRLALRWEASDNIRADFKYEYAEYNTDGRNVELTNSILREDLEGTGMGVDYLTALNAGVAQYNGLVASNPDVFGLAIPFAGEDGTINGKRSSGGGGAVPGFGDISRNEVDNFLFNLDWGIGDHTLTWVSSYLTYETDEQCDCDYVGVPIIDGTLLAEDYEQFSQEIRLTSPGGETIDWIAGAYYQTSELDVNDKINLPEDGLVRAVAAGINPALIPLATGTSTRRTFSQDTDVYSAFAQATWNISDVWRLTFGARYTYEDKDGSRRQAHFGADGTDFADTNTGLNALFGNFAIEAAEIADSRDEDAFTPLVTVQWDVNDDVMAYATYVTGFKSGGFDNRSNAHPDPDVVAPGTSPDLVGVFEYEDEEAESFEIGFKSTLLDGAAELNGAIFYTEYTDLQTSVFDGTLGFNVENAGEATTRGMELDGRWLVAEWFTLTGAVGYLDFEFDEFPVAQCWFGQAALEPGNVTNASLGQCDAAGQTKEFTPEWTSSLTGDFNWPLGDNLELVASLDIQYTDDYLWNPTLDPRTEQDAYTNYNARIGISAMDGTWDVAIVGRNLSDEEVVSFGGNAPLAGALTEGTGMAYYAFTNRPRSFALQARYRF